MAKVTDFKTLKKRQARRRSVKLLVLVALILLAAYLFSSIVNTPSFAGLSSVLDMIKGGPGYPIDAPGGKVKGMYQNGSSVVLLNETTIYFYNTSGSEVYSELHRMSNPQVETSGNMLLNYDRGSKSYAAYSRNNLFYSATTDDAIRCGDISSNGCIAIATQTDNAQSRVTVLDSHQREQYTWKSDNVVTAMTISDNGSSIAIGSSYVEEGELKNVVTVLRNGEEQGRYELANQLVLDIEFDSSNVRCVTDKSAILLASDGSVLGQFDYNGRSLAGYALHDDGIALVFGDYEQDRKYTLASVADDFVTLNGTATLEDTLQKIKCYEGTILILGGSTFQEYSVYDCSLLQEVDGESYYDIQPLGNSVYAMTTTEIVRLTLETPNRLSFFSNKEQVQLPEDAQQEQQTQEELDLLQSILDGMEQQSDELTVGESGEQQPERTEEQQTQEEQTQSEPPAEEEQQEQSEPSTDSEQQAQEESPAEETEQSNQEPSHVTVQNEDSQPEYSSEDQTQSPQEEQDDSQQDQGGFFSSRPAQ